MNDECRYVRSIDSGVGFHTKCRVYCCVCGVVKCLTTCKFQSCIMLTGFWNGRKNCPFSIFGICVFMHIIIFIVVCLRDCKFQLGLYIMCRNLGKNYLANCKLWSVVKCDLHSMVELFLTRVELFLTRVKNNNQIIQISNLLQLVICNIFSSSGNVHVPVAWPGLSRMGDSPTRRTKMRTKMRKVWGKIRKKLRKFEEKWGK